jgi:hypothetical protein
VQQAHARFLRSRRLVRLAREQIVVALAPAEEDAGAGTQHGARADPHGDHGDGGEPLVAVLARTVVDQRMPGERPDIREPDQTSHAQEPEDAREGHAAPAAVQAQLVDVPELTEDETADEEERALEERVRCDQVRDARERPRIEEGQARQHHAGVRDRRVGEQALQMPLHQAHDRSTSALARNRSSGTTTCRPAARRTSSAIVAATAATRIPAIHSIRFQSPTSSIHTQKSATNHRTHVTSGLTVQLRTRRR